MARLFGTCRHCGRERVLLARGLCSGDYKAASVRALYRPAKRGPKPDPASGRSGRKRRAAGPTLAEVDAGIARVVALGEPGWWRGCQSTSTIFDTEG